MYARLGVSNFIYSNPLPLTHNYTKLEEIRKGNNYIQTSDTKYVISDAVYNDKVVHHPKLGLESQFFDKIKVPEQAYVIQRPIAKEGR